jgi:hypothetical protein
VDVGAPFARKLTVREPTLGVVLWRWAFCRWVSVADQVEGSTKGAILGVGRRLKKISGQFQTLPAGVGLQYSGRLSSG